MNKVTLNLTSLEDSQLKYKISKFPDGQQKVDIDIESYKSFAGELSEANEFTCPNFFVEIQSRFTSFRDLELIVCANQDLLGLNPLQVVTLYVPYFLGARSDRKFGTGETNYLKNVVCPVINSQNFKKVTVLDAHSDVLESCLNNYAKRPNIGVVSFALAGVDEEKEKTVFISPDAGALKKIFDVAKAFGINNVITAGKVRDIPTGKIVKTEMPDLSQYADGTYKFFIIDDICDGGRTFIEIKKAIELQIPNADVYLVITHGIFSAGFAELNKAFKGIFCTNSYVDIDDPNFNMANDNKLHKLHQLNVF